MNLFKIDTEKMEKDKRAERIIHLKTLLSNSDYKMSPDYDKDVSELKKQRQEWREEIRKLEEMV